MRKALFFAFALALLPMAAACDLVTREAESATLNASHTSVAQASSVKAAGDLYAVATHAATAYLKSGRATPDQARQMVVIEMQVYDALLQARQADKDNNSPALGAALALFNANYSALARLVPGLGG